ncbi:uncharacterized protein LOC111862580 [Cryptotermes secundus]|uniref:uncharacterized protein LOC111862580 n=1 Tax=Cryptotermes secundus TaxID=105785 RepID=UPI000CD7D0A3|nr:uncharacterized protein LOC111862580 [Cryptotermes secundus]
MLGLLSKDVAGSFQRSDQGDRCLLIAMDDLTKWGEAYAIPNQEARTIAEALVTKFFCCFGIPQELHSDQGRSFESHLLQEVLQRLGVSKTHTTPLHPQSDGMPERYIKTIEEHLRKVVAFHQKDWDESLVFGRELRLPCDLLFGVPPDKELPTIEYAADLVDHLHDIHNYALKHLKLASDRTKTRYDILANSTGYYEGDRVNRDASIRLKHTSLRAGSDATMIRPQ